MADIDVTQGVDAQDLGTAPGGSSLSKAINALGAVASLALVAGVSYWGYALVMRDVSGVPVVRALEGPMRVQPEDPGGLPADHQGLAVNAVAADGIAEKPADRLILAPRPIDLTEEDAPMSRLAAVASETETETEIAAEQPELLTQEEAEVKTEAAIDALVRQLTAGVAPLEPLVEVAVEARATDDTPEQAATVPPAALADAVETEAVDTDTSLVEIANSDSAVVEVAVLRGPGMPSSLRPQARPARLDGADAAALTPQPAVLRQSGSDVDPDSLPLGTRLAQLGAYDSPDVARAEWDRLSATFSDYFEGKSRVIQQASSGGRTFYRLRAMGFDDLSEARRFCSVLVADNADCIPVTVR